jgi:hypothetical protein
MEMRDDDYDIVLRLTSNFFERTDLDNMTKTDTTAYQYVKIELSTPNADEDYIDDAQISSTSSISSDKVSNSEDTPTPIEKIFPVDRKEISNNDNRYSSEAGSDETDHNDIKRTPSRPVLVDMSRLEDMFRAFSSQTKA